MPLIWDRMLDNMIKAALSFCYNVYLSLFMLVPYPEWFTSQLCL